MSQAVQAEFARALLDRDDAIPAGLAVAAGCGLDRRFAVHRTNVAASLCAALAARFPATERIVGPVFFAAMARAYVDRYPPKSPVLLDYGSDLAGFVAAFVPAAGLPYLGDVIRLEDAWGRAYHAADVAPLDAAALAQLQAAELGAVTFVLHPAAAIIRSRYPIVTICAMNTGALAPAPIARWIGEDALVTRPQLTVEVRALPVGGGPFLSGLASGATLGTAAENALVEAPDFDLATNLTGLLQAGVVASIR